MASLIHSFLMLLVFVFPSAVATGSPPETLADFTALSNANLESHSIESLTGLHPSRDWPLHLWVEQSARESEVTSGPDALFLSGVKELSSSGAAAIATSHATRIFLPDLVALDREAFAALVAGRRGTSWFLNGLTSLSPEMAELLVASHPGGVRLDGITTLSIGVAEILARVNGSLSLGGLKELSPSVARALGGWKGNGERYILALDGLDKLGPVALESFAACRGWGLSFGGLQNIAPEVISAFSSMRIPLLSFGGVREMDMKLARALASFNCKWIELNRVVTLEEDVRAFVASEAQNVSMRSLQKPGAKREGVATGFER